TGQDQGKFQHQYRCRTCERETEWPGEEQGSKRIYPVMRLTLILLFCSASLHLMAQDISATTVSPQDRKDSVRRHYIQSFPDHFFIYPVIKQRSLNFE